MLNNWSIAAKYISFWFLRGIVSFLAVYSQINETVAKASNPIFPDIISPEKYDLVQYMVARSADGRLSTGAFQWSEETLLVAKENRDATIKLYPELNHLDQEDEKLISLLRYQILIKPPNLEMCKDTSNCVNKSTSSAIRSGVNKPKLQRSMSYRYLDGQFHQPSYVEHLLGLKNKTRIVSKRKSRSSLIHPTHVFGNNAVRNHTLSKSPQRNNSCSLNNHCDVMLENYAKGKFIEPKGFFVEAGAGDGEIISNSLYFELKYGWTGLLVEPNPDFHDALISKNRNAWILPHCLSTKTHPHIADFFADLLNGGILNEERTKNGYNQTRHGKYTRKIQVQCFPLYSVLKAVGNPKVNYLSLDIEGAEFQVLKTVPWKLVSMDILGIETKHAGKIFEGSEDEISSYLHTVGYGKQQKVGHDLFFMRT